MSRHGGRTTDGAGGHDGWPPGEYDPGWEARTDGPPRRGEPGERSSRRSRPSTSDTSVAGPPWDQPGGDGTGSLPATGVPLGEAHPSGPLPPLPPLPPRQPDYGRRERLTGPLPAVGGQPGAGGRGRPGEWQTSPAAGHPRPSYPAGDYRAPGHPSGPYPAGDYRAPGSTGGLSPAGDYRAPGHPSGPYPAGDYRAPGSTGGLSPAPDRSDGRYPGTVGGYPASPGARPDGGTPGYSGRRRAGGPGAGQPGEPRGREEEDGYPGPSGYRASPGVPGPGYARRPGDGDRGDPTFPGGTGYRHVTGDRVTGAPRGYGDGEYRGGGEPGYPGGRYHGGGYVQDWYPDEDYPDEDYQDEDYQDEGYPESESGRGTYPRGRDFAGDDGWDESATDDELADADRDYDEDGFLPGLAGDGDTRSGGSRSRDGHGQSRRRGARRLAPWLALSVILLMVAGVAGVGYHYYVTRIHPPDYSGKGYGWVEVQIKPGDTATEVGVRLQRLGVVASVRAFSNAAVASPQGKSLEPGYYRVHKHMAASLALSMLLNPSSQVVTRIVIPEGWRVSTIISRLGAATGDPAGYRQAIKDTSALGLSSYADGHPEGFLFPATYPVQPGTTPVQVLRAMAQQFSQEAASLHLVSGAAHDGVTPRDVIIIASLVQAEGTRPQDLPKIARVIYDRLNAKMPLQLDSTVRFAMHSHAAHLTTGTGGDTSFKSPYNTYLHTGLPPGPIDCPGATAIKAALHPAAGNWRYFITVNSKTGLTKFTSSYTQFQQFKAQAQG